MAYEIHPSARKHGVADADIVHAIEQALSVYDYEDENRRLYLGPDAAANLLEIVTIVRDDGTELVIHAMPMQPKYGPPPTSVGRLCARPGTYR